MKAHPTLLQLKYDSVIEAVAKKAKVSLREALDMFYKSPIYEEVSQGISDMHCRSDGYLAEDIMTISLALDSRNAGPKGAKYVKKRICRVVEMES
jgi:hypothetical protein